MVWSNAAFRADGTNSPAQVLEAKTLDELKDGLLSSYARLDSLGIFKSIEFLADAGPDVRSLETDP